jgi:hypothetical protein
MSRGRGGPLLFRRRAESLVSGLERLSGRTRGSRSLFGRLPAKVLDHLVCVGDCPGLTAVACDQLGVFRLIPERHHFIPPATSKFQRARATVSIRQHGRVSRGIMPYGHLSGGLRRLILIPIPVRSTQRRLAHLLGYLVNLDVVQLRPISTRPDVNPVASGRNPDALRAGTFMQL